MNVSFRLIVAALAVLATVEMGAQEAVHATSLPPETVTVLQQLAGRMLISGQAYEYDRQLADGIGARLTGSANYVKATDWAVAEFTRLGLKNVHKESWTIPATWEPETVGSGRILEPHEQRLHLESEGWSPSTPESGVRGKVFHLPNSGSPEAIQEDADKIRGSIILIDRESNDAAGDVPYGQFIDGAKLLAKLGAIAVIDGNGTAQNAVNVGGGVYDGSLLPLPTANLGSEDSLELRRLLEHGPVTVEFSFRNRIRKHVSVDNVLADIPGRELTDEVVMIAAHLDSWHPGTGAQDNGTGSASVVAVAQAVMALNQKPRRTLRFALFGGEEEGLLGSHAYAKAHEGNMAKLDAVLVTDSGGEAPKGWMTLGRADLKPALAPIQPLLAGLGAGEISDVGRFAFATDHADFMVRGVPALMLWTGADKYRTLHHKPSDTFDKVDQRDLTLGAAVVGLTAYAIADEEGEFAAHFTTAQVEEQMRQIKKFDEYKDMRDRGFFF